MDILGLLEGAKNRALELRDIEILKHTYELQEDNSKQLKESNQLLRDEVSRLKSNHDELKTQITKLQSERDQALAELQSVRSSEPPCSDDNDCMNRLQAHLWRYPYVQSVNIDFQKLDRQLNLIPGSTAKHISAVVARTDFHIASRGANSAILTRVRRQSSPPDYEMG
jgi:predicted RNase H-like nuclease (RuvC/YqgF family)